MFQKMKVWWALRKARKLENEKVLGENDIAKDEKLFIDESDALKKLINKTLMVNKDKPIKKNQEINLFEKKSIIKKSKKKIIKKKAKVVKKKAKVKKTVKKASKPKKRSTIRKKKSKKTLKHKTKINKKKVIKKKKKI
jgi:hypothetical protein